MNVRVIIAPPARTCSQKIANLQAGIAVESTFHPAFAALSEPGELTGGTTIWGDWMERNGRTTPTRVWHLAREDNEGATLAAPAISRHAV